MAAQREVVVTSVGDLVEQLVVVRSQQERSGAVRGYVW
jgi:hypothetical protein